MKRRPAMVVLTEEVIAGLPPKSPAGCRRYIRSELTKGFPDIVTGFVKAAKTGSVPHVKLATELLRSTAVKKAKRPKAVTALLKKMAE